jgi:hypothetical protein
MEILTIFKHAIVISFFVFVMMLLVDFVDTVSQTRMARLIRGGRWRQYTLAAFLGDHTGCLARLLQENKRATVCHPASFPARFTTALNRSGIRAHALQSAAKIDDGGYSTGVLVTWVKEQSLMIPTDKGTVLLTGCAQPGIVKIVAAARAFLNSNVYFIV